MTLKAVHEETTAPELFRFSKAQRKSSVHGQHGHDFMLHFHVSELRNGL